MKRKKMISSKLEIGRLLEHQLLWIQFSIDNLDLECKTVKKSLKSGIELIYSRLMFTL
jgi:hypothetical protein